ncbi:MAG: tripartite tricarboxylate transporter substrate-binding protein, partial [Xanthobacteraceae bacterium]
MIPIRPIPLAAAILLAVNSAAAPVIAQDWPSRPVTMVVPFAPGGGTDVLGRIVARQLSQTLGQQVIVENIGGAGGMIGSAHVVNATPDGYEFDLGSRADAINQTLYKHPLYDLKKDLVPVILIADQAMVLIARKDLPVNGL